MYSFILSYAGSPKGTDIRQVSSSHDTSIESYFRTGESVEHKLRVEISMNPMLEIFRSSMCPFSPGPYVPS